MVFEAVGWFISRDRKKIFCWIYNLLNCVKINKKSGEGSDAFSNGLIELKFDILNHCSLKIRKFSNFGKFRNRGWITCMTTDIFIWRPKNIIVKIDRFSLKFHFVTWYWKLIEAFCVHSVRHELRFYQTNGQEALWSMKVVRWKSLDRAYWE